MKPKYPVLAGILSSAVSENVYDRKSLLQNFNHRLRILAHVTDGDRIEALYPNDHFSPDDVAFGYLKNNQIVMASDFKAPGMEVGYIAHIVMLVALGYAKDENDTHPQVDYRVRGIVKADMSNAAVFWETPRELLEDRTRFDAMLACLRRLLSKKLISKTSEVFGSGEGGKLSLGSAQQLLEIKAK